MSPTHPSKHHPAPNADELTVVYPYQMCERCVMDTTDPDIRFDPNGVCNHCKQYEEEIRTKVQPGLIGSKKIEGIIHAIKTHGADKPYDCILGVSGGVDSTYVAYLAKQYLLRPLAVHFDNGWNSELAVRNIERALKKLDMDLYTYVVDWDEFKDLQLAFLRASIENAEIPTDHGINALLFKMAEEHGVKYILSGDNIATECVLPSAWSYEYWDLRLLTAIHQTYGRLPLKTFPTCSLTQLVHYTFLRGIKRVYVLDYLPYNKAEAMRVLERELNWQYYGGKHYESIYTRFFQAYIVPKKFGYDKRRAHLSSLICAGQLSRLEALKELKEDPYDKTLLAEDKIYVMKKLGLSTEQFEEIMSLRKKSYRDFPSNHLAFSAIRAMLRGLRKISSAVSD